MNRSIIVWFSHDDTNVDNTRLLLSRFSYKAHGWIWNYIIILSLSILLENLNSKSSYSLKFTSFTIPTSFTFHIAIWVIPMLSNTPMLYVLDHVQNSLVLIEPHVVIWNGHCLESDGFGVLEEWIRSPHIFEPFHLQQSEIVWK